jgi:putative copper resistance protein D
MIHWLALTRFLHITGSILLAAVFAFRMMVFVPATAAVCGGIDKPGYRGVFGRLMLAAWLTTFCSGLAWFGFVAASIGGEVSLLEVRPETVSLILLRTQFGHLWLFRIGCCLFLGVLFLTGSREWIKASFAFLILASLGGAGHPGAKASSAGLLALTGDIGHLIAAAVWPGGLVPLVCFLHAESRTEDKRDWALIAHITRRFSAVSLAAVAFLAATGILNAWFVVGSLTALCVTGYGQLLLVKIGLFFLMIGFGAWNLLVLKPGVVRLATADKHGKLPNPIASLIRNVVCETALAVCLLLIVGVLGVTPPPAH